MGKLLRWLWCVLAHSACWHAAPEDGYGFVRCARCGRKHDTAP